jgi:hypothetical protein
MTAGAGAAYRLLICGELVDGEAAPREVVNPATRQVLATAPTPARPTSTARRRPCGGPSPAGATRRPANAARSRRGTPTEIKHVMAPLT